MPRTFRALPPALFPFFSARWTPWGKTQPAHALLRAVQEARVNLNGRFDFSARPSTALSVRDHLLNDFQGSLLEAWHRLHAATWEQDLAHITTSGRRPLKMHTAWPTFLRSLKAAGLRLDVRQHTDDTLDQRPVWFDDAQDHPHLLQFWLDEGVDPGMTYSSVQWSVWLGIDSLPEASVRALLAHGLSAQQPVFRMDEPSSLKPLGSLARSVEETMASQPDFWTGGDPRAQRWHSVAMLLVQATPDLSQPVLNEQSGETVVRTFFPTVWAEMEQRAMQALLDVPGGPMMIPAGRRRL